MKPETDKTFSWARREMYISCKNKFVSVILQKRLQIQSHIAWLNVTTRDFSGLSDFCACTTNIITGLMSLHVQLKSNTIINISVYEKSRVGVNGNLTPL